MENELLALLIVKKFTIKAKKVNFTDVKFMSASEKTKVYNKWISFLNNHFSEKQFSKALYGHLYTNCGYIAHYNLFGFYGEYFEKGAILNKMAFGVNHTPNENSGIWTGSIEFLGKDALETKRAFYDVYDDLINGHKYEGLKGFKQNWNGSGYMGARFDGDYGDLNVAMRQALQEYVDTFEDLIDDAKEQLKKAEEQTRLKELKAQKERIKATMETAKTQLDLIDKEIVEEVEIFEEQPAPANNGQLSLFDFVVAA